ncbi:MAG: peptide ABC transporter [Chloracidobacterium sp. CP2_5A]|nr:MAG: peptide ABC transporter [Chloracidobacterium sp. CP2_5A]
MVTALLLTFFKRMAVVIPVMWAVVTLVFLLIHLVPGDPVAMYLGDSARPEDIQALRHKHGLDLPLWRQYVRLWIGASAPDGADKHRGLLRGDLGETFAGKNVMKELLKRYPATLKLAGAAILVAAIVALPLGIAAAVSRGSWLDTAISVISLGGIALPNFVIGPLAILIFAVYLDWLPVSGSDGFEHFILPAVTLGLALAAILTRLVRSSVIEELDEDYVRAARAKGLPERVVLFKHVLKNSLIPVVTIIGLQFGIILTGAIVTETIFSMPGVGDLTVRAINEREYNQVQANLLAIALTYVTVNTLTDLLYRLLDPRIALDR